MEKNDPTQRMLAAADRVDNLDERVREIEVEMAQHEAQCEERWKTTFNRLQDIEDELKKIGNRIITASGSIIVFLAGVIITLLMRQRMIYQKRGTWRARVGGKELTFASEQEAKAAMGIIEKPLDPLEALRTSAPVYNTFEEAVDDHGEDEGDFVEED